jgi:vacuolar-type H+-ATPase subunit H
MQNDQQKPTDLARSAAEIGHDERVENLSTQASKVVSKAHPRSEFEASDLTEDRRARQSTIVKDRQNKSENECESNEEVETATETLANKVSKAKTCRTHHGNQPSSEPYISLMGSMTGVDQIPAMHRLREGDA